MIAPGQGSNLANSPDFLDGLSLEKSLESVEEGERIVVFDVGDNARVLYLLREWARVLL